MVDIEQAGTQILRYEVPVDDQWHTLTISGDPLHVAARDPRIVEFWALGWTSTGARQRRFRVYGTGQLLDADAHIYRGTVLTFGGQLVWHLFESVGGLIRG